MFRRWWTRFIDGLNIGNETHSRVLPDTSITLPELPQTILSNNLRNCSHVYSTCIPPRKFTRFASPHDNRDISRMSMQKECVVVCKLLSYCLKQYTFVCRNRAERKLALKR